MDLEQKDNAAMQAECVVRALDAYLAMFPWPAPTVHGHAFKGDRDRARDMLVRTLAASIRMSEPRKSDLQRSG